MSSALVFTIIWLCTISACCGCILGMGLTIWHYGRIGHPNQTATEPLPGRDEIQSLISSLAEINSQVDARVGRHSIQVEEITGSLNIESYGESEPLIRAAQLLVTANQRLQSDLVTAKTDLQHQRELVDSFRHESRTDGLTELFNRRAFDDELSGSIEKFKQDNSTFSLLFVDIDHFKRVNDNHGHLNGDQVLLTVAQCLKSNLKVPASVSRYGGEEFAIILPGVAGRNAMKVAEQLRQSVERCPIKVDGTEIAVTVSIGVAESIVGEESLELIERSDQALFAAKNAGRNHCCFQDWVKARPTKKFLMSRMDSTDQIDCPAAQTHKV